MYTQQSIYELLHVLCKCQTQHLLSNSNLKSPSLWHIDQNVLILQPIASLQVASSHWLIFSPTSSMFGILLSLLAINRGLLYCSNPRQSQAQMHHCHLNPYHLSIPYHSSYHIHSIFIMELSKGLGKGYFPQ